MRAERMTDTIAYHAEGPVWWPALGKLRFVDMLHGAVVTLDGDRPTRTPVGSPVVAVLRPRLSGGAILATEHGVSVSDREDLSDLRPLVELFDDPAIRCNEGGCDPDGRFYVGTMAYEKTQGAATLYRIDGPDAKQTILTGLTTSNGIGWSPDGTRAYFNDTPTKRVDCFDYDPEQGLTNRRPLVTVGADQGSPDGLCVDAEGGIWVAMNKGSAVHRYSPDGTLSERIELPVRQVTACTFGGEALDRLFITTSRENLPDDEEPAAGSIYTVQPGVTGLNPLPCQF